MTAYKGPIIDVDIHHRPRGDADLTPYLSTEWRDFAKGDGRTNFPLNPPPTTAVGLLATRMLDSFPEDGSYSGSSYALLRDQLLDKYPYYRGVLTHDTGDFHGHPNPYFANAVCQAVNQWNLETWLSYDDRLYGLIVSPTSVPELAAAEIRRVGAHPKMLGILIAGNTLGRPLGDPIYHPIYAAAAEMGLMIAVHPGAVDRPNQLVRAAGGPRANPLENVPQICQSVMHYLSSLIVHGVFEKFPDLRFIFKEQGLTWLPSLLWGLDANYELLRSESPWVRTLPSEVIAKHVKFSTQPLEESPDDRGALVQLLSTVDGIENLLCFSTDYPHVSYDDPLYVARVFPDSWHRKVFSENACSVYDWEPPTEASIKRKESVGTAA